jgi:hypothetical protein
MDRIAQCLGLTLSASALKDTIEFALTAVFCTLCLAAGWFYLTRSDMVSRLSDVESPRRSAVRHRIRRLGACCMIALAAMFFYMMWELNRGRSAQRVVIAGAGVGLILIIMLTLAIADLYLTYRTRRKNTDRDET